MKDELAKEVRAQAVTDKMQTLGDQMHADLVKSPKSAAEVAKKYGADLIAMPSASPGEAIPGLGANPEIDSALAVHEAGRSVAGAGSCRTTAWRWSF